MCQMPPPSIECDNETDNEHEETDESEDKNQEDSEDFDAPILRAKWMFDGAATVDECIDKCNAFIEYLKSLKSDGWELLSPVADDYGFMKRTQET